MSFRSASDNQRRRTRKEDVTPEQPARVNPATRPFSGTATPVQLHREVASMTSRLGIPMPPDLMIVQQHHSIPTAPSEHVPLQLSRSRLSEGLAATPELTQRRVTPQPFQPLSSLQLGQPQPQHTCQLSQHVPSAQQQQQQEQPGPGWHREEVIDLLSSDNGSPDISPAPSPGVSPTAARSARLAIAAGSAPASPGVKTEPLQPTGRSCLQRTSAPGGITGVTYLSALADLAAAPDAVFPIHAKVLSRKPDVLP